MSVGDPWCLISFSIPEERRAVRHQLRKRLQFIGCGTVAAGLWISPGYLVDEVAGIIDGLGLGDDATLFETRDPQPLRVSEWWDLDALAAVHREFLVAAATVTGDELTRYVRGIDLWRPIPYVDPGLAAELLPAGWPGFESEDFYRGFAGLATAAEARLEDILAHAGGRAPVLTQRAVRKPPPHPREPA
jgi:phenylacetic acid degradation operon negative regulatory protein